MASPKKIASDILNEIDSIIITLIEAGLSIDQQFTSLKRVGKNIVVSWGDIDDLSIVLKNVEYEEIYNALEKDNHYNIKLIDGSLIQMMYKFNSNHEVISHRLGFFPCINLQPLEKDHEMYEKYDIYADILKKNTLPTIFRFDFDEDESLYIELDHAKSHLTFGQYSNCRIPVSGPVTPKKFVDFILRNFYYKAMKNYNIDFNTENYFTKNITEKEQSVMHLNFM